MSIDEFDTPPELAAELIRVADLLCENEPRIVADFAVGTGALLAEAQRRWPKVTAFGCDISDHRVEVLSQARTDWTVVRCNFLDPASRSSLPDLEKIRARVDLAVLNPPFSVRGGTKVDASIDGQDVRCSPAMAFVLFASQYLSHDGNLVALLPAGALEAERDHHARAALKRLGEFEAIPGTTTRFPGGNSKVTIAYFKRGPRIPKLYTRVARRVNTTQPRIRLWKATDATVVNRQEPAVQPYKLPPLVPRTTIMVLRGTSQNQALPTDEGESVPLVHSTELRGYKLQVTQKTVPSATRSLSGPAVLIHRVGRPRQDKIAFVPKGPPFAITDCVVALLSNDEHECARLHRSLTEQFGFLERNYVGSGAPYITIERIRSVLHCLGFASKVTNWNEYSHGAD